MEHYDDCPASDPPTDAETCRCDAIDHEEAAWREEPNDMFAREWGTY
ncbi:hypothetical protein ACIQXD_05070 [Streptomyces uncialis]